MAHAIVLAKIAATEQVSQNRLVDLNCQQEAQFAEAHASAKNALGNVIVLVAFR